MPPSKANPSAIGLMDGAFFVSRGELLAWLNGLLSLNYTKVEQISTGAAMCQVLDAIYPGSVNLRKVNFGAKTEYDSIKNWKVLQAAFNKKGVDKHVDVDKLIKGKYQDNLEFFQWMKRFYDMNSVDENYEASARRNAAGVSAPVEKKPAGASGTSGSSAAARRPVRNANASNAAKPASNKTKENMAPKRAGITGAARAPANSNSNSNNNNNDEKVRELNDQIVELKLAKDGLEKERDFYFGKLRDIEVYLQTQEQDGDEEGNPSNDVAKQIFAILYATEDEFVAADEIEAEPAQVLA